MVKKMTSLGIHWWMLALTAVLFGLVTAFVDLKPVVDENFFFSTRDPQFRQTKKIEKEFPSQTEVIFAVASHDISSPHYLGRIQRLTQRLRQVDAVSTVKSLTEGPKNFEDAMASPTPASTPRCRVRPAFVASRVFCAVAYVMMSSRIVMSYAAS